MSPARKKIVRKKVSKKTSKKVGKKKTARKSPKSRATKTTHKKATRKAKAQTKKVVRKTSARTSKTKPSDRAKKPPVRKSAKAKPLAASAPRLKSALRKGQFAKTAAVRAAKERKKARVSQKRAPVSTGPAAPTSPLGTKYECFACSAKFYDLNRPEPICPKCGADQRQRPSQRQQPSRAVASSRRAVQRMAPLLDDDEDAPASNFEVDLGHGARAAAGGEEGSGIFDEADAVAAEDEAEET
ncbi:MAG: FYDLN acid domain-containing protein [Myxococcota bacterium]